MISVDEQGAPANWMTRLGERIAWAADIACSVLFVAVFAVFCFKIASRYLAADAVAWADEVSVICFIWIVFIANGFVMREQHQISFDIIHRNLSPVNQRRSEIVRLLLVGGLFTAALPNAVDYVLFLWRERTPVLEWRLDFVYFCFALYMVAISLRSAARLATLIKPERS